MIAVVIPVYNREKEILQLIDSLLVIDYPKFKIIVVNNSTRKIEYFKDKSIKVLNMGRNYGATAGFNAGIKFALQDNIYKYLWLLDSDIVVEKNCLKRLLEVMGSDKTIGIVGPKILNSEDRDLVVEIGGNIDLNTGNIFPVRCNQPDSDEKEVYNVDYLGSGISFMRTDAIKDVGLMDEDYYYLWDDIDYCLNFKKKGYRVVSVSDAVVYHPPFTEKRDQKTGVYYGIRNMHLLLSKHGTVFNILRFNCVSLRKNLKNILLGVFNQDLSFEKYRFFAYRDFITNKLGKGNLEVPDKSKKRIEEFVDLHLSGREKVIILANSDFKDIGVLIDYLKEKYPDIGISILCRNNRKNIFRNFNFDEIITFDDSDGSLLVYLKLFFRLIRGNFDLAINPNIEVELPYEHIFKRVVDWDSAQAEFHRSGNSIFSLWKLVFAVGLSEILAVLMFLFTSLISFRYRFVNWKRWF